ncbi:PEP-CTERM sorting domain-containing protein, partial [Escherichia coli]|nr:PEP-CTERM sorting domain-containing protein [Escherichia coli]
MPVSGDRLHWSLGFTVVPEPQSLLLMLAALIVGYRRRLA